MTAARYCVMQPYFFPYAAYYRLMLQADVFVIFDNAQFPRRGRVHRCQLADRNSSLRWFTLPLVRCSRSARISEVQLAPEAGSLIADRLAPFPDVAGVVTADDGLRRVLMDPDVSLLDYLDAQLRFMADSIGAGCRFVHASQVLARGSEDYQDYIIGIGRELGAREYVNAPGGRALYSSSRFQRAGIDLQFLPSWEGPPNSVLQTWPTATTWLTEHAAGLPRSAHSLTRGR